MAALKGIWVRTLDEMFQELTPSLREAVEPRVGTLVIEGLSLHSDNTAGIEQLDERKAVPFDAVERIKRRGRDKLAALKSATSEARLFTQNVSKTIWWEYGSRLHPKQRTKDEWPRRIQPS